MKRADDWYKTDGLIDMGQLLKNTMIERRMSGNDLAAIIGISATTVADLIKMQKGIIASAPKPDTLIKISRILYGDPYRLLSIATALDIKPLRRIE